MVRDDRLWTTFCDVISRPELANDPRYTDRQERRTRALELHTLLEPIFASKTYALGAASLQDGGIPFGVIGRVADGVIDDEQARHRRHLRRDDEP